MKYNFEVRAVAREEQSIEEKHQSVLAGLDGLPAPWGIVKPLPAPDPGGGLSASLKVAKLLGKGLRGDLVYQFRRPFRDEASQDDYMSVVFDPEKIDYKQLVATTFLQYVSAFDGYYAEISDDEFIFIDFEKRKELRVDKRHGIYRIPPVSYVSRELSMRALGFTPNQVVERLQGKVESVQAVMDGVLIVLTSKALPTAEMNELCWKVKGYL